MGRSLPDPVQDLQSFLAALPPGEVAEPRALAHLLDAAWHCLKGGDQGGMESYKLHARMEDVRWEPPRIRFALERHGRTVNGSTRADLQHWVVDVAQRTARIEKTGHRQLRPMAKRVTMQPLVEEIVQAILSGAEDRRLERKKDGLVVVKTCDIFPKGSAVNMTLAGRRKRFRAELAERLKQAGWRCEHGLGRERCTPPPGGAAPGPAGEHLPPSPTNLARGG